MLMKSHVLFMESYHSSPGVSLSENSRPLHQLLTVIIIIIIIIVIVIVIVIVIIVIVIIIIMWSSSSSSPPSSSLFIKTCFQTHPNWIPGYRQKSQYPWMNPTIICWMNRTNPSNTMGCVKYDATAICSSNKKGWNWMKKIQFPMKMI